MLRRESQPTHERFKMNNPSRKLALIAALFGTLLVAGCGQTGGGEEEDTPEANAFRYREGLMTVIAAKMAPIGAMARGEMPVDEQTFVEYTNDLAALSNMVSEGFETEGIASGSASLPEIWTNMDDFQQKLEEFQQSAEGLAEAANNGGFEAARGLVQGTAGTCGGCHRSYRRRAEE
jgi:cytochrome c556